MHAQLSRVATLLFPLPLSLSLLIPHDHVPFCCCLLLACCLSVYSRTRNGKRLIIEPSPTKKEKGVKLFFFVSLYLRVCGACVVVWVFGPSMMSHEGTERITAEPEAGDGLLIEWNRTFLLLDTPFFPSFFLSFTHSIATRISRVFVT